MKFPAADYLTQGTNASYRIDSQRRVRIEEYHGKVALADLKAMVATMTEDPGWSPYHHALVDFQDADLELSANDILRLAFHLRRAEHRSYGWVAFVVSKPSAFGMIRMLGYWSRNTDRFRIFESRAEGEAWLERNAAGYPPGLGRTFGTPHASRILNAG